MIVLATEKALSWLVGHSAGFHLRSHYLAAPLTYPQTVMNNNPLTIAQILGALNRHRFAAFITWLLVMVLVVVAFLVWPRKYGSEGALYVKMGRNNTGVTPGSGVAGVTVQDTRETEIRSVVEIIKSAAVIEAVVNEIGADAILESQMSDLLPDFAMPSFFASGGDHGSEYEKLKEFGIAVKQIGESMSVEAQKKTSIVSVYVKAGSAKLAQQIVTSILKHTNEVYLKIHAANSSKVFLEEEVNKQELLVDKAEQELAAYRNSINVVSVDAERNTLQATLSNLKTDLLNAETNLIESTERLAKLTEVMAKTEAQIAVPTSGVERLSYEDSRTELFKLEAERERLAATYERTHPEVQRVEQTLLQLKKSLDSMNVDRTESVMESNPVYEQMQVDYLRAKVNQRAAEARFEGLKKMQERALSRLPELNEAANVAQKLQREIDIATRDLFVFSPKRGEARIMAALDEQNISGLATHVDATFRVKHISPRGSLIIPLGFICGLLAALAVALFLERNHLSGMFNEGEVEQILDLPVLVTLPRVYSSRNMVN